MYFAGAKVNVHDHNGETPLHVAMGGYDGKEQSVRHISDLTSQVSHLRSHVSSLTSQISRLSSQVSDLRLKSHVSDLTSQISHLTSQVSDLRSQISRLKSHVSDLTSQISSLHVTRLLPGLLSCCSSKHVSTVSTHRPASSAVKNNLRKMACL